MTLAMTNDPVTMASPRKDCQMRSWAFWTILGSPFALKYPYPAKIRLINVYIPARIMESRMRLLRIKIRPSP